MFRFLFSILVFIFTVITLIVIQNSQRTFEAKFNNIDGLPTGAKVTALGVEIGKVIRTKPVKDGIIVTVKLTNKKVPRPEAGSQLTITSFRPNQGRVLEIIPPSDESSDSKAWIIQEPITTESWLFASLNLLDGLKAISGVIVKQFTHENIERIKLSFSRASDSLNETVEKLSKYQENLLVVSDRFGKKASETNELILRLQKPILSLNKLLVDKDLHVALKNNLPNLSEDLTSISTNITREDFLQDLTAFKISILDRLNEIGNSLRVANEKINNPETKQKIKDFNLHLENLNAFYSMITEADIHNIGKAVQKAREFTTKTNGK